MVRVMPVSARNLALTAHVTFSVGWLGAVGAFLVLAIAALGGQDPWRVRAACVAMDVLARSLLMPLAVASAVSGVVLSVGTHWGLIRHYWVVAKIILTVVSIALLRVHMVPVARLAAWAREPALAGLDGRHTQVHVATEAGIAVAALLAAVVLSVYKPRGMTAHGRRALEGRRAAARGTPLTPATSSDLAG